MGKEIIQGMSFNHGIIKVYHHYRWLCLVFVSNQGMETPCLIEVVGDYKYRRKAYTLVTCILNYLIICKDDLERYVFLLIINLNSSVILCNL